MTHLSKEEVLLAFLDLSRDDRAYVLKYAVLDCSQSSLAQLHSDIAKQRFLKGRFCPHCYRPEVVCNGKTPAGVQRYLCKNCGKTFTATTKTVFAHAKRPELVAQYLECMEQQLSLRKAARQCGISLRSSFLLRHRILDVLRDSQPIEDLDGIVEADETFIALSFKGNHRRDGFAMPRGAHKRGHAASGHNPLVCVITAIDRESDNCGVVSNLGKPSQSDAVDALQRRIVPESTLCTDRTNIYDRLGKESYLCRVQLLGGRTKHGLYHIQNINQLHSSLKSFLIPFKGVSTKYLPNYLIWHNRFHFRASQRLPQQEIRQLLQQNDICTTTRKLSKRPAVPITSSRQLPQLQQRLKEIAALEEKGQRNLNRNRLAHIKTPGYKPEEIGDVPF